MNVCTHCGGDYAAGVTAACRYCRLAPDMLFRFSLPESPDGPEEVAFDVSEWDPSDRVQLGLILTERNVPWRWDPGPVLVTQQFDEAVVEELLDEMSDDEDDGGEGDDGEGDEGDGEGDGASWEDFEGEEADEAAVQAMNDLFLAADHLVRNPVDGDGIAEVGRLRGVVAGMGPPFGIEPQVWDRIATLADAVTHAAGEGMEDDDEDGEEADEDGVDEDGEDVGEEDGGEDGGGISELDVEADISGAARTLREFLRTYV